MHVAASVDNTVTVTAAAPAPLETQSAQVTQLLEVPAAQTGTVYAGAPEPQGYSRASGSYSQSVVGLVSTSGSTRGPDPVDVSQSFQTAASGVVAPAPVAAPMPTPPPVTMRQTAAALG